jgi:hypothetical protein
VKKYCKSYQIGALRGFPGWSELAQPEERDMADDERVFLCDEFTVLISPVGIHRDKRLLTEVTPEWQDFCTEVLKFRIPDDLAFAYAENAPETGPAVVPGTVLEPEPAAE